MDNQTKDALLRKVQALSFAKVETELYLDTHPTCRAALDYYEDTVKALKQKTEEYESKFSPITAGGALGRDSWTWVDTPWPWQMGTATPKDVR